MNRDLVSQILSGRRWPTVKQLDSLVRVLASRAVHVPDENDESQRFLALWMATEEPFGEETLESYSADPVDRAFEKAGASGDVTPIIELAIKRPPAFVIETVERLKKRKWTNFANGLIEGLADRLEPSRIPAITALFPRDVFPSDVDTLLQRFSRVRAVPDVSRLAILFIRAGVKRDAVTLIDVVQRERPLRHTCELYVSLRRGGCDWQVGNNWNTPTAWPETTDVLLQMIREFHSLGYPEGVPVLVARYGKGRSGINRWSLYEALTDAEMWDAREALVTALIEVVSEREVAEFVSHADSAGDRRLASKIVRCLAAVRSEKSSRHFKQWLSPELAALADE
ncbi:hypothetical protein [Streptomyces achromogenes]|uniref:hypothetical protein n=1 Tax=Streptomyces achromogenes TaxID=67255 RepID=UPI003A7F66AB